MKNNPLFDTDFLYELDHYRNRIVYVRILSLTSENYPIEQIEGVATGGDITIDGASSVRRVVSLTMTTKNLNINNIYWGLNARVKIEVGLENKFNPEYPKIIWFPQGVFLITEFKTSSQVNNYVITLSGKDKMCLLNGDVGGVFNAETDIGQERIWDEESGKYILEKRPLAYVIREMVHHYAKENFGNIIIKLDSGKDILQNRTGLTLYVIENEQYDPIEIKTSEEKGPSKYLIGGSLEPIDFSNMPEDFIFRFSADEDNNTLITSEIRSKATPVIDEEGNEYTIRRILDKEDLGYQIHELDFPNDLIAGAGDTVTSILDKIIQRFSGYEYFYNLYGQFVFQPKDTYVNTSWNNEITNENENYIMPMAVSKKVKYAFEGNQIITAFQNNPKLSEIKNDFTIWGTRTLPSDVEQRIHMRYAIDEKPKYYVTFNQAADGKKILYITEDYYKELQSAIEGQHKASWLTKKTKPPQYLLDAHYYSYEAYIANRQADLVPVNYSEDELNAKWWDILEWAEYYKEIFGDYPDEYLMNYGVTGFICSFTFPDGTEVKVYPSASERPSGSIMRIYYADGVITSGRPTLIFDTYKETGNPYTGGVKTTTHGGTKYHPWDPFQHGFNGCGHTYQQFLARANGDNKYSMGPPVEAGVVQSWIYDPQIPKSKREEFKSSIEGLELYYELKIVDWREIIYQMALDYYAHNHEDEFHIKLFHNNDLFDFGVPRIYDLHGMTGYEQYYHDMEGFWRTLYIPAEIRNKYFSLYRKLTGRQHELPKSITWAEDNNSFTYDPELKDETIHIDNLSQDEVEFYIDEFMDIRNVETDNLLYDDSCPHGYTLETLVNRDLAIKVAKDHYYELQNQLDELQYQWNDVWQSLRTGLIQKGELIGYKATTINTYTMSFLRTDDGFITFKLPDSTLDEYVIFRTYNKNDVLKVWSLKDDAYVTFTGNIEYLFKFNEYVAGTILVLTESENADNPPEDFGFYKVNVLNDDTTKAALKEALNQIKDQIDELSTQSENEYDGLQQAQLALCSYSLFYKCDVNEEDFYGDIEYTPNGYPIYIPYSDKEASLVGEYNKNIVYNPQALLFWFDFYDANSLGLGQFSVPAIGSRPYVKSDDSIKALIYQDVPDFIFVNKEKYEKDPYNLAYYGYSVILLEEGNFFRDAIEKGTIVQSTRSITAQEAIDEAVYIKAYANEEIQLTTVPIYYLEPNIIISARDEYQLVNGYYILNKMVIPLTYNGTMKNTCIRVPERIY